jgi:hypothetical protein
MRGRVAVAVALLLAGACAGSGKPSAVPIDPVERLAASRSAPSQPAPASASNSKPMTLDEFLAKVNRPVTVKRGPRAAEASGPARPIRVTYLAFKREARTRDLVRRYIVLASQTWAERFGTEAWEPYAKELVASRADGVADADLHLLLEGLKQAGLTKFPRFDWANLDEEAIRAKKFAGLIVTVETDSGKEAYALRDPVDGRPLGEARAVLTIDLAINRFANEKTIGIQTQIDPR